MDALRLCVVLLLVVPSAAAVISALLGRARADTVRWLCLGATLLNLALSLAVTFGFLNVRGERPAAEPPAATATFRPELVPGSTGDDPHHTTWNLVELGSAGAIQLYLGVDGISVWLVVLTNLLLVASVLVSWTAITDRVHEYHAWLMALGTAMLGVFLAFDVVLFYVFFELTLVPLFFLIGIWGGPERRHAARKFFVYTLFGSLITFLGILAVVIVCYIPPFGAFPPAPRVLTFSIPDLVIRFHALLAAGGPEQYAWWASFQTWVFLAMFIGFAIKVPLFPVQTWLPLAHVEAPTAGSVLLAGILLKLGTYGFLRLLLPFTPDASIEIGVPLVGTLSVIGILYGAFCARGQDDIKKLVAYSSVSHLGFCTLGLFALNTAGLTGGVMQMINHGLSTGGLFLIVGMLYERYHTRLMSDYGGIGARLGLLSASMVFICLSSVGLPGLNGFIGEALVFFGMFDEQPIYAVIGTGGIILGAWYLMTMLRLVFFGAVKEPHHEGETHHVSDLNGREIGALLPILAACLFIGVYPQPILDSMRTDIHVVSNILERRQQVLAERAVPPDALALAREE
jgi:NADH-quinone oxidoreductase subunit M